MKVLNVMHEKEVTYAEVYVQFKKATGIDGSLISDYRPCIAMYDVPTISNAIVVWLKSGSKLIYVYK